MIFILILSLIAPLEPISWSELKLRISVEPVEPDTAVVESDSTEVSNEED